MKKRLFSIITALALCLTLLPATALAATNVTYYDWNSSTKQLEAKTCSNAIEVTSSDTSWGTDGTPTWYVAQGEVTITGRVDVKGHVHLILADNCRLTINNGIQVNDLTPVNTSLTIYGQSEPVLNMDGTLNEESTITGKLIANAYWLEESYTGIGPSGGSVACKLTINGGVITAIGASALPDKGGSGIGCATTINGGYVEATGGTGCAGITGHITINGGTVKATGGTGSAGIGGNRNRNGGTITITGGTVTATGGADGAGIGGGYKGDGGEITISGGTVTANGGEYGAGIGGGARATGSTTGGNGGTINISGGTVKANGGSHGAGIGGGSGGSGGSGDAITISGNADITAEGGTYGAGIGGGSGAAGGTIKIEGGKVNAIGDGAAGIGGGNGGAGGTITINGGDVTATVSGNGAGIGGGGQNGSNGGTINITAGIVKATGGVNSAGIGGGSGIYGSGGSGGKITISGSAHVTATGGSDSGGAGIGGGAAGSSGTIKIEGGTVIATGTGSVGSAGIGGGGSSKGGGNGGNAETITISGGTVTANGSVGIGGGNGHYNSIASNPGGNGGAGGTITISGGTVIANGSNGAGIGGGKGDGGGSNGDSGTFATTNSGNAIIKASSIAANDDKTGWSGIIFEGSDGGVYGNQTLSGSFTVGSGENLLIAENATLTTNSKLTNSGKIYVHGTLSGSAVGEVYYPLFLTNCTASKGTSTHLDNTYAKEGATVKLTATFDNPSNQLVRSWVADPQPEPGTGGGNYYDISSMPANAVTVTANIEDALTINTQPQDVTITYGKQTTLSVDVSRNSFISGSFLLSYQWYENDAEISGANSNSYTTPADLPAGSHNYTCKITCSKYNVTSNIATVTVGKATGGVTITGDPGKIYDGQPAELTAGSYTVTGDGTVTVQYKVKGADDSTYTETAPTNAGDYTVKVTKAAGTNFTEASATKDFTISRKPVTVSGITANGKTYDGKATATLVYTNAVFTGKLESDTLSVTATGTFEDKNVGTDKTVNITGLTLGGDSAGNYILAVEGQQATTTASISVKPVTVSIEAKSSAYGAAIAELTATANGIVDGDIDVYALATSATSSSPVGTYDITGTSNSTNYALTFTGGTDAYTITAASQSATVTMEGWTYGDTPNEPVVTGNAENGAVTYRYKVKDASDYLDAKPTDAGSYTVEATIAATANYQETVVSADFTIAKKELTVTGLTATDRTYDGTKNVTLTGGTLSGIIGSDDVSADMPTAGTMDDANAGENKSVDFGTITLTGTKAGNYTLTQPTVTVTISKADPAVGTVTKAIPDTIYTSTALGDISLSRTSEAIDGTLQLTAGQTLTAGIADYGWTFTPTDSTNYKTVTGTISLTVESDTLSDISIGGTTPAKTSYKYGETFQTNGLTVTATYASGNTRDVTAEVTFGTLAVGDTSIELSYQGKTCVVSGLTVRKADAPTLADISVWQKYTVTTEQSKDIGTAGMPDNAGTLTYAEGTATKNGTVSVTDWGVDSTGKVTYTLFDGAVGDTVTLPVVISSTNYEDATVNINIELTAKDVPTVNANDITVTYTGSAVPDSVITGTASVDGTWSFKAAAPVNVTDSSDSVTVVFTPTVTDTYETVEDTIKVTINKATPTGTPAYTAITTGDKTLADAALTVGTITPAGGSIAWDLGDSQTVSANTAYNWTYTPAVADQANYNNLTGSIKPYVVSSSGSGGSSTPTYSVTAASTKNGTVSVSPKNASKGDTVTITVKPDKGYELDTLKVLDKNGDRIKVTEKNGVYTFTMPASKVTIETVFTEIEQTTENPFKDVSASAYYYDAVIWAAENGITGGTSATTFSPNAPCTRAQIVTFLWRTAGSPVVNYAMNFSDVPADAYYAEAVRWAVSQGITTGTGDGTFSPNATCTRAQAMTFIYRSEQAQGGGMQGAWMFQNPFFDVDLENYYGEAVMWAVANGITNGTSDTTFSPGADCTRAQIVTFLYRFFVK